MIKITSLFSGLSLLVGCRSAKQIMNSVGVMMYGFSAGPGALGEYGALVAVGMVVSLTSDFGTANSFPTIIPGNPSICKLLVFLGHVVLGPLIVGFVVSNYYGYDVVFVTVLVLNVTLYRFFRRYCDLYGCQRAKALNELLCGVSGAVFLASSFLDLSVSYVLELLSYAYLFMTVSMFFTLSQIARVGDRLNAEPKWYFKHYGNSMFFLFASLGAVVLGRVPVIFIERNFSSLDVGVFFMFSNVIEFFAFPSALLAGYIVSPLRRVDHQSKVRLFKKNFSVQIILVLASSVGVFTILKVLGIYNEAYFVSTSYLLLMTLLFAVKTNSTFFSLLVECLGGVRSKVGFVACVSLILFCLLWVFEFKINVLGLIMILVGAYLVLNLFYFYCVKRLLSRAIVS